MKPYDIIMEIIAAEMRLTCAEFSANMGNKESTLHQISEAAAILKNLREKINETK